MNIDGPGRGSRRPLSVATGDLEDDRHSFSNTPRSQHTKGGKFKRIVGDKVAVDANVRSAGKNIHDRRDRNSTQKSGKSTNIVTVNVTSTPCPVVPNKPREKRRHEGSLGSESESNEEQHHHDSRDTLLGQVDDVADTQSRSSSDYLKRPRRDTTKLVRRIEELKEEFSEMTERLRERDEQILELQNTIRKQGERISKQIAKIQNQAQQISAYENVEQLTQKMQEAQDDLRLSKIGHKDVGEGRQLLEEDDTVKELEQKCQDLEIIESRQMEKAKQKVICLKNDLAKIQEKKRNASSNAAAAQQKAQSSNASKEAVQEAKAQGKRERERERSHATREKQIKKDLDNAEDDLNIINAALTTLRAQATHHSYRPSYEHRVCYSQPVSDSGYGTSSRTETVSSVSVASPTRSTCSTFSNIDDGYNSRQRGYSTLSEDIAARPVRPSLQYRSMATGSSSGHTLTTRKLPPRVPTPPPAGEMSHGRHH